MSTNKIPLYISAEFGDLDYVMACLASGMKASDKGPNGEYPLHAAARGKKPVMLKLILDAYPEAVKESDGYRCTALHHVFRNRSSITADRDNIYKCCEILLDGGANVNYNNIYGNRPFQYALDMKDYEICALLIRHGADLTFFNLPSWFCEEDAKAKAEAEEQKKQAEAKAREEQKRQESAAQSTPTASRFVPDDQVEPGLSCASCSIALPSLFCAIRKGHVACFQTILKFHPGEIKKRNGRGQTCLHMAMDHEREEFIKPLVDAGADLEAIDQYGRKALDYAIFNHRIGTVRVLISCGAEITSKEDPWVYDIAKEVEAQKKIAAERYTTPLTTEPTLVETPTTTTPSAAPCAKAEEVDDFSERCRAELMRYWCDFIDDALHKAAFVDHEDYVEIKIVGSRLRAHLVERYQKRRFYAKACDKTHSVNFSFIQ